MAESEEPFPFALFSGDWYYPLGGWSDFQACYQTLEDAMGGYTGGAWTWAQVVDLRSLSEVATAQKGEWRVLGAEKPEGPLA